MKSNDLTQQREQLHNRLMQALREENKDDFYQAFDEMTELIGQSVSEEYEGRIDELRQEMDSRILASRGVRQLTSAEQAYYTEVIAAMKSRDPKQALASTAIMPQTIIESVFDDLRRNHPLLSRINFIPSGGAVKMIINNNGEQTAVWGALCDEIIKELTASFTVVDTTLLKLSAFLPVCKQMLDLGPAWIDRYVREVLYEALANGLEYGIVAGDGDDEPIGMNRQVGTGVTVVDGVYPEKVAVSVTDLSPISVGNLISLLAVNDSGAPRKVDDVLLIVNPADYYTKVGPATTFIGPDGVYHRDVLPYPMTTYQSAALTQGKAILGIARGYAMVAGTEKEGRIDYSDHYHFLEDERIYLIKLFANGRPKDNHSFIELDISDLVPFMQKVEVVDARDPSTNALLSDLKIAGLTLSPAFDPEEDTYTSSTTAGSAVVAAWPADAAATIKVEVGDTEIPNGSAATFAAGLNVITITVTAEDGETEGEYTVTVTKS